MTSISKRYNPFSIALGREPKTFLERFLVTFQGPLEKICGLNELARIYDMLPEGLDKREFLQRAFDLMNIKYEVAAGSLENIPATGPVILVANHPFGGVEGMLLAELISERRPDLKILANWILGRIREISDFFLFVDPFGTDTSAKKNIEPVRESLDWVKEGHILGIFPSGTVSHLNLRRREISDPDWNLQVARIVRKTKATVVPIFFEGRNGFLFQLLGLIHPLLRTAALPRELANKQNYTFRIKIGQPVHPDKLASYERDEKLLGALRLRTYLLADYQSESKREDSSWRRLIPGRTTSRPLEPIVRGEDKVVLFSEVEALSQDRILLATEEYTVYCTRADEIPHVLREIGRLREITFRDVAEGTGQAIDLDNFDNYYHHLFVWNNQKHEVVGAYRLGKTDVILRKFGKKGLYTSTLFDCHDDLLEQISPALELGRSFVRREYQRSYLALLLLWRGIGQFVVKNPKYNKLFGPVSINSEYESISRRLIITFLRSNNFQPELAKLIKAKNPMKYHPIRGLDAELTTRVVSSLEDVNDLLAEIESKQKSVPVLLRQYLKLGGTLLGFNVDPKFGNVLDGLLLVDLLKTEVKLAERYLGKAGAQEFLAYHAAKKNEVASTTTKRRSLRERRDKK